MTSSLLAYVAYDNGGHGLRPNASGDAGTTVSLTCSIKANPSVKRATYVWRHITAVGLAYLVRSYFESATQAAARANAAAPVHADASEARITKVAPQVKRTVVIQHRRKDGVAVVSVVNADKYSAFVSSAAVQLEAARSDLEAAASAKLRAELSGCFQPVMQRASLFADWYFGYQTSYVDYT